MPKTSIDPVTFEVIRHRLWAVNDEAAAALELTSGSPIATEVHDFNTGLLNARGDVFVVGTYITAHATPLDFMVKDIIEHYSEKPGIFPDDMFICSDPYSGPLHQSDVTIAAPIFAGDDLVAWCGSTVHQIDLGGAAPGQVNVAAQSIYAEGLVMPPVKLIERGEVRADIERFYLRQSRFPTHLELDLRAKIAANNVAKRRVLELVKLYGAETVKGAIEEVIDYTEKKFRARLRELPDGTWRHVSFLDFNQDLYPVKLALTKQGDSMVLDFTGTARQSPAIINCTYAGLLAGALSAFFGFLCPDIPWCPAGILKSFKVISEPGTVNNAQYPAGVSKATTSAYQATVTVVCSCVSKMMAGSEKMAESFQSPWSGSVFVEDLFGIDQYGRMFGTALLDCMAQGGGARSNRDGIDTGGTMQGVGCALANIESYEFVYPLLYLHRKQQTDGGGAGKFRGGAGLSMLWTPYMVDAIWQKTVHAHGIEQPEAPGISGAFPGSCNPIAMKRETNVWDLVKDGHLPTTMNELGGELQPSIGFAVTSQNKGDVFNAIMAGGGGYGDPLEREPQRVLQDVVNQMVSIEWAEKLYGVIIDSPTNNLDKEKTLSKRKAIREERAKSSKQAGPALGMAREAGLVGRLNEYLQVAQTKDGKIIRCKCGLAICAAGENYKDHVLQHEGPLNEAGPWVNPYRIYDRFNLWQFYCPGCLTLLGTEVTLKGEKPIHDYQLS